MSLTYEINRNITAEELSSVFERSGIRRPDGDLERLGLMIANADLIVTARDGDKLVGVARALTDFSYCCYLSDLAVDRDYQRRGIGKELVRLVREAIGDQCSLLLVAAPEAQDYYGKIGFTALTNGWIIKRVQ